MSTIAFQFSIALDLFPMISAVLACVGCGLLGNFLLLRKASMMGDAISHSVLPGMVIAFLLVTSRSTAVMFIGAAVAGVATVVLIELIKRFGRVDPGAAMGVVFSVLFALGVLLIEQASARHVDLDPDCLLHGQLETLVWYGAPSTLDGLFAISTLEAVPRQVVTLAVMVLLSLAFVLLLFKELRLASFDPGLSTSQGFNATGLHLLLMVFVAIATVASFEAVGSILVIAMLVCPAATARLMTDRLSIQLVWSVFFAVLVSVCGYIGATAVPEACGKPSVNAAGSIAVFAGFVLTVVLMMSPSQGVVPRLARRRAHAREVALADVLSALYRAEEPASPVSSESARRWIDADARTRRAFRQSVDSALVTVRDGKAKLTVEGESHARVMIRRHRLWETYLVDRVGLAPDHVHDAAEQLEHLPTVPSVDVAADPHGKPIPREPGELESP